MLDSWGSARRRSPSLRTQVPVTLPRGYVTEARPVESRGVMRLATAATEIWPQRIRVCGENPTYLSGCC